MLLCHTKDGENRCTSPGSRVIWDKSAFLFVARQSKNMCHFLSARSSSSKRGSFTLTGQTNRLPLICAKYVYLPGELVQLFFYERKLRCEELLASLLLLP